MIANHMRLIAVGVSMLAAVSLAAQQPETLPALNLTIKDLTPKFLKFYDEAVKEHASPERRWELWKKEYDFAAVPPTPEGEKMARGILDDAWPKYPAVLDRIRAGASGITPEPHNTLRGIAELLRPEKPVNVTLLVYVGGLDGNAFTAAQNGKITTALPIEDDLATRALRMTHELTHAVHISMGSFSGGWIRTIGTTVLTEGLAMRATEKLLPGHPEPYYVEARPGWFEEAAKLRPQILRDVREALASDKSEDVMRFTMGRGPSGIEREAYYAGWVVVGYWLEQGKSFAEIARIPEKEMPNETRKAIDALLGSQ